MAFKKLMTPGIILGLGIFALFLTPALLVLPALIPWLDFSKTGEIGDTIGGLTAPVVNTMGAILVYFAFRAQVSANGLLQGQIEVQKTNRKEDNESATLFEIYGYLVEAIDNFYFGGFSPEELNNAERYVLADRNNESWKGAQAIYTMLDQIRCHYHGSTLDSKQEVAELIGILRIMELLTERLKESIIANKSILATLIEHQFRYRIMTRLKDCRMEDLAKSYCADCDHEHGIPDAMLQIFKSIDMNLKELDAHNSKTK